MPTRPANHLAPAHETACALLNPPVTAAAQVKRRSNLVSLDYLSFVEALARVTCFKPLPTHDFIVERGAAHVAECIDGLVRLTITLTLTLTLTLT